MVYLLRAKERVAEAEGRVFHSMRTGLLIASSLLLFAEGAGTQALRVTTPVKLEQTSPAVPPEAGTHTAVVAPAAAGVFVEAAVDTYLAKGPPGQRAETTTRIPWCAL